MTTEYTVYYCFSCGATLTGGPQGEKPKHNCQATGSPLIQRAAMTEERVCSLIAEALTEKEEHIRRVVRQKLEAGALADEVGATLDRDVRNAALEEAASIVESFRYTSSWRSETAAKIRSLKHTLPDQERQGEEIDRLRSDLKKANEALDGIAERLRKDTISKRDADDKAFLCVWDIVTIVRRAGRLK